MPSMCLWDMVFTWYSGHCLLPAVTFDVWPFDLISMSQAELHTWPNCGEICSNIYENVVFIRFLRLLPAVTLTFDLWSQKLISTSTNPNTSVTEIGRNSLHWFVRYGVHKVFVVTLTFELPIPKSNHHIYEPKYIRGQNWVKFPLLVFEIWCS